VARNFAEIQRELAELSPEQRAKLALALVESLEPEDEGDVAEAWRVEAERRYEQFKRGEVQAISGDEVFARIRSRLRSG
jgi:putative addiction module component (TIGR02574 family)